MDIESLCSENGLKYGDESLLTIERRKHGKAFHYFDKDKNRINKASVIKYLNTIIVPPVYKNVVMSSDPKSHLLAIGLDTKGNKQYFYHPKWEQARDNYKFSKISEFARILPKIRRKVALLLNRHDLSQRNHVLAGIVKLLDHTGFRIGHFNENKTYGLTTLKKGHVDIQDNEIIFDFIGKGGQDISRTIRDEKLLEFVDDLMDISGHQLFQYHHNNEVVSVTASQVNSYIKEISGNENISAKDFRTWRFSCLFVKAWRQSQDEEETLKNLLKEVSNKTCNTPSILRKSYIHPKIIEKKKDNYDIWNASFTKINGLRVDENLCLYLIEN